jgi:hypothetical protein
MNSKKLICVLPFFILLLACKDKDSPNPVDDLPPETQTGAKTFGCLVNGRAWVPSAPFPLNSLTYSYYQGTFSIRATLKKDGRNQVISINKFNILKADIFYLTTYNNNSDAQLHDFNTQCTFDTSIFNIGTLEMTRVDSINGIFSGRFHFKIGVAGCDTIRVTDGRFDLRL